MRMRGGFLGALIATASLGMISASPGPMTVTSDPFNVSSAVPKAPKRKPRAAMQAQTRKYRSRWKAERRKPRRNMNHVSRRVRRRHRRNRAA